MKSSRLTGGIPSKSKKQPFVSKITGGFPVNLI
jgi:hypothetical protein